MSTNRIKNIEFLRVIGCIAIILLHLCSSAHLYGLFADIDLYKKLSIMTCNGQKAVDLFFMLSGLFFALKLDTSKSLWEFIKNKLIRLYPVLIFITIVCLIASSFGAIKFTLYDNIIALLYLNGTGLAFEYSNIGISWYISTMLWVLVFYYFLLKYFPKEKVNMFIICIILLCYSFIIHARGGKINGNLQVYGYVFSIAMMRGFAGIGVGYFIGEWYKNSIEKINKITVLIGGKLILTCFEGICLFFIINNLMLHKLKYNNHIIFIIVFAVTITLFLFRKGFISKILEADFWGYLSKYTYSLYMTHVILMHILKGSFWKYHPEIVYAHPILNIVYTVILVLCFGICTYHFVEKPCGDYLKRRFY